MRKLFILILGFILVFGFFAQVGFCEDEDPCEGVTCPSDCDTTCSGKGIYCSSDCGPHCSGSQSAVSPPSSIETYYYYSGSQHNKIFTTDSNHKYWKPEITWHPQGWCDSDTCTSKCCSWSCHCHCEWSDKPWYPWYAKRCNNCGDGRTCDSKRCKGWCIDHTPVYDNDLAGCNIGSSSVPHSKYTIENMDQSGGCDCRYLKIKKYYECDSSQIDDSHPCSSGNCAPDFVGGRNYCCDSEQCAHRGEFDRTYDSYDSKGTGTQADVYCFDSESVIQHQGYKLKCNDGNWEFIGGEKADFTDNCGKTIFNYPLFFNSPDNNFYPDGYGYKDSYAIYPVSFEGTKDIVAYTTPADDFVEIKIDGETGSGDEQVLKGKASSPQTINFSGNKNGNPFNLSVNCYTPDRYNCDSSHDDCWPGSYCSQDNPTNNFVSDDDIAKVKLGVKILNNNSDVKCWINGEKILDMSNFLGGPVRSDEIALEDYNLIACKVEAKEANSGFDAKLYQTKTGGSYFDFGDIDGGIETAPDCSISTKWRYTDSVSVDDWKNKFDYDDSDWEEKPQPFGSYKNSSGQQTACTQDKLKTSGDTLYLRKIIEPNYLFYCCPNNSCAHPQEDKICWEEGAYNLTVSGESEESTKCLWDCKNGIWRKREEGGLCYRHCDCADSDENNCVPTLHDLSKKICCNIGECGLGVESRCTDDSYCCPSGHSTIYKGNLCQCNAGSWTCSNTAIKTDYSRILFSKNSNKHETTLEVSETELRDINSANAKVLVFFDKKDYDGDITITGLENCSSLSLNKPIENKIIEDLGGVSTTGGFSCKLEITVDGMDEDEYFFYTGSTLVLEYI